MEYKRYDRNAIVDESKYKGKVLLMDNPLEKRRSKISLKKYLNLLKNSTFKLYPILM